MTQSEIKQLLEEQFGVGVVMPAEGHQENFLLLYKDYLYDVCSFLYNSEKTYFDFLTCITGVDNGAATGTIDVIYNLYSIPYHHHLMFKVQLKRNLEGEPIPEIHSVAKIWKTANWLERETYDLMGIKFMDHPDLRRILLPADWEGHPLRKDFKLPDTYHGIQVEY